MDHYSNKVWRDTEGTIRGWRPFCDKLTKTEGGERAEKNGRRGQGKVMEGGRCRGGGVMERGKEDEMKDRDGEQTRKGKRKREGKRAREGG